MGSSYKVLIIDDTEEVLSALCKYFKQKGYDGFIRIQVDWMGLK